MSRVINGAIAAHSTRSSNDYRATPGEGGKEEGEEDEKKELKEGKAGLNHRRMECSPSRVPFRAPSRCKRAKHGSVVMSDDRQ